MKEKDIKIKRSNNKNKKNMRRRRTITYIGLFLVLALVFGVGIVMIKEHNSKKYVKYLEEMNRPEEIKILDARDGYEKLGLVVEVKEMEYNWEGSLDYNNNPQYLVYHHTASTKISPEKINEMHRNNGWSGIGYHYYIRKDGVIYKGRPEEAVGAHTIGRNKDSIGICLEGNFEEEQVTDKQKESLELLSLQLILKYNIKSIIGHKEEYSTLCPGENFPMDKVKNDLVDKIIVIGTK